MKKNLQRLGIRRQDHELCRATVQGLRGLTPEAFFQVVMARVCTWSVVALRVMLGVNDCLGLVTSGFLYWAAPCW